MDFIIRKAEISDVAVLLDQLKNFSKFIKTKRNIYPKEIYAQRLIDTLIREHVFLVAEDKNGVQGFITGTLSAHFLNPDIKVLTELFWWVNKEHRSSGIGKQLLEDFIEVGRVKADWMIMTIEDLTPIDDEILIDNGFKIKEKNYLLEF